MMTDDKIQRMQQLIRELNEASDAYYNGQAERMTDYEWDARFDELRSLEQETGTTMPDSPTQKVSEDSITGQKEEHELIWIFAHLIVPLHPICRFLYILI